MSQGLTKPKVWMIALTLTLSFCLAKCVAAEQPRTWSSANGKFSVEAELMKVRGDMLTLRRSDGKNFDVKLSSLGQGDRDYVEQLQKRRSSSESPKTDDRKSGQRLSIPGIMSIESPGNGFAWNSGGQRLHNGIQAYRMGCTKKGSRSSISMYVEVRKCDTDEKRVEAVRAGHNELRSRLDKAGLTKVEAPDMSIKSPIPDTIQYTVSAVSPEGLPVSIRVIHLFQENTYRIHVIAESDAEADELGKVASTITEIGTTPASGLQSEPGGRFRHGSYGFSYQPPEGFEVSAPGDTGVVAMFREAKGSNVNFRCIRKSSEFNLETTFERAMAAPAPALDNYQSFETGDIKIGGRPGKWRAIAYSVQSTSLKVVQYYFSNDNWVFIATGTAKAEDFDALRPGMDAAMRDMRFE